MLNPAFLHPSPATAPLNRASDAVLLTQEPDVLPSGHSDTLTEQTDERTTKNAPSECPHRDARRGLFVFRYCYLKKSGPQRLSSRLTPPAWSVYCVAWAVTLMPNPQVGEQRCAPRFGS